MCRAYLTVEGGKTENKVQTGLASTIDSSPANKLNKKELAMFRDADAVSDEMPDQR
jgi:hypothetical protein